jgi:hypothetical protein
MRWAKIGSFSGVGPAREVIVDRTEYAKVSGWKVADQCVDQELIATFMRDGIEGFIASIEPSSPGDNANEDWHLGRLLEEEQRAVPSYCEDSRLWPGLADP